MATIIRDTREQHGFAFLGHSVIDKKLNAGDYALDGDESGVVIERKASLAELYGNLSTQSKKARFYRELDLLTHCRSAIILCEFPKSLTYTFPKDSGIPVGRHKYIKIGSKYLRRLLHEVNEIVPIVYCVDRAEAERMTTFLLLGAANDITT